MTLHSRLNDELIKHSELQELGYSESDVTRTQRLSRNALRGEQRDILPTVSTRIAQDLLALIGEDELGGRSCINCESYGRCEHDARDYLRDELRTKIRQYCGIREGSDV